MHKNHEIFMKYSIDTFFYEKISTQRWVVTFKLITHMHIGWRKTGNLQQTPPYVTGRALWWALTATLVHTNGGNDYQNMGKELDEQLAFTYFYLSTKKDTVTCYPWDDLYEFSWKYLGSYASAALQYGHGAEDGSLHETEFIAPAIRDGEPVYIVGYIFEKDKYFLKWTDVLNTIQLGGERGYGWGSVSTNNHPSKADEIFGLKIEANSQKDRPVLIIPKDKSVLDHTFAENIDCKGIIEPLVGRGTDTKTANFGKYCSTAQICWSPGARVNEKIKIEIFHKGLWHRI
jgi:hypothetical protein